MMIVTYEGCTRDSFLPINIGLPQAVGTEVTVIAKWTSINLDVETLCDVDVLKAVASALLSMAESIEAFEPMLGINPCPPEFDIDIQR